MVKPYDDNGRRQTKTVHSLVLLGFAGPPPPGMESRHLDDDPLNNRWAPGDTDDEVRAAGGNLVYGTKRQNTEDQYRNGGRNVAPPPPSSAPLCPVRSPVYRKRQALPCLHNRDRAAGRGQAPRGDESRGGDPEGRLPAPEPGVGA